MTPPRKQRIFASVAAELNYLNDSISHWWYHSSRRRRALQFRRRFAHLLAAKKKDDGSIALQEHWALLHEVDGNLQKAIAHRKKEIFLLQRALRLGGPMDEIDYKHLAAKYLSLARLHSDNCSRRKASYCLSRAKKLAEKHRFKLSQGQLEMSDSE